MNSHHNCRSILVFGLALLLSAVLSAQAISTVAHNTSDKVLVVNGKTVEAAVRQIDGRSFVDIEALAQATNGAVTVECIRGVLTIPQNSSAASSTAPSQAAQGLSRDFAKVAVAEVAEMREWRGVLGTMVTYG